MRLYKNLLKILEKNNIKPMKNYGPYKFIANFEYMHGSKLFLNKKTM